MIDLAGQPPEVRTERAFRSIDLDEPAFGWNLPNWLTRKVLAEAAAATPGLTLHMGTRFDSLLTRDREALVTLSDGTRLSARLAIAAPIARWLHGRGVSSCSIVTRRKE